METEQSFWSAIALGAAGERGPAGEPRALPLSPTDIPAVIRVFARPAHQSSLLAVGMATGQVKVFNVPWYQVSMSMSMSMCVCVCVCVCLSPL
jgi:hypothetical protein